jgi:hypothetical protein
MSRYDDVEERKPIYNSFLCFQAGGPLRIIYFCPLLVFCLLSSSIVLLLLAGRLCRIASMDDASNSSQDDVVAASPSKGS